MKVKDIIPLYLNHLKAMGRSERTVTGARYDLHRFERFLEEEGILDLEDLTSDAMYDYQQSLAFSLTAKGTLMTLRTQAQLLGAAKGFTRFLKKMDYLIYDPGEKIKPPRKPKTLPRSILTASDIRKLLNVPDMRTHGGYRNRIILEVLYDTAIRRDELSNIMLARLDLESGFIHITGKGSKDRVVPPKPPCV